MNKNEFIPKIEESINILRAMAKSTLIGNQNIKTEYYKHLMSKIEGLELAKSYFEEIKFNHIIPQDIVDEIRRN